MGRERLEIEFGRHAGWIVEAIEAHGLDAIPAACRGAGDPNLFGLLADAMGAKPGTLVLDVGCGIGGPGAWLASERRCDVVGIDVMEEPVRGLKRLFPQLSAVVASSRWLPFRNATFDATWAIGVIETIAHKNEALKEVARVLVPDGRLAAYTSSRPAASRMRRWRTVSNHWMRWWRSSNEPGFGSSRPRPRGWRVRPPLGARRRVRLSRIPIGCIRAIPLTRRRACSCRSLRGYATRDRSRHG
ncbi:MAG TPA: class I SAM-dependent methyltransferase [Actinomycetota bacterium]|nr:class I SAM-dependent methyltransferase [Actinomycetota bacterium]